MAVAYAAAGATTACNMMSPEAITACRGSSRAAQLVPECSRQEGPTAQVVRHPSLAGLSPVSIQLSFPGEPMAKSGLHGR
jgi:hypothetical protein